MRPLTTETLSADIGAKSSPETADSSPAASLASARPADSTYHIPTWERESVSTPPRTGGRSARSTSAYHVRTEPQRRYDGSDGQEREHLVEPSDGDEPAGHDRVLEADGERDAACVLTSHRAVSSGTRRITVG